MKDIGEHFGGGESGVSQANSRMVRKMASDKKLKERVNKIEIQFDSSRMKT